MKRPEILAPAGTPHKLKTALHFGADAVYLGLKRFSLRSSAGNFDLDELEWALGYAHDHGRRVYVCVNILAFDSDLDGLQQALRSLRDLRPDGLIVADPGVVTLSRQIAPAIPIHLSTQTSVTNEEAAKFWFSQGVDRIVVARELHLDQLGELVHGVDGVIEAFVHGAVCIAFSGRCLLSLYWANRDPRRGACAQGCRWEYRELVDKRRPGQGNPIEQDERGSYFFDAKDLCALPLLDRLIQTGVGALKIEGRTRSIHYLAVTVDVYRHAVDRIVNGDLEGFKADRKLYIAELSRPGGRGFSTHFLNGEESSIESYLPDGHFPDGQYDYVGEVVRVDDKGLVIRVQNPIHSGCDLELRDRGLISESLCLTELRAPDGSLLDIARTGDELRVQGRFKSSLGALVRRPSSTTSA